MEQGKEKILYVDDENENLMTFKLVFREFYDIQTFNSPKDALSFIRKNNPDNDIKVIISDQRMPELNGIQFLEKVKLINSDIPAIILTGYGSKELLEEAINSVHIHSFADKPWKFEDLKNKVDNAINHFNLIAENKKLLRVLKNKNEELGKAIEEIKQLKEQTDAENKYLREELSEVPTAMGIITKDKAFQKILSSTKKLAKADSNVLIYGETGTGKELIARFIHESSTRNKKPLIKINCAAIPSNLMESEMFGYEKGAFTGAVATKIGRFELANGGTLFLDEIGEMPLDLQSKLLRVLQENEFERLGGIKTIQSDFRLITATNRDLEELVEKGAFREDLFYRLNVIPIKLPSLRERKSDISVLAEYFARKYSIKNSSEIIKIPASVIEKLESYDWPGNIREMENIIERAVITSSSDTLEINTSWIKNKKKKSVANGIFPSLEESERTLIVKALDQTGGIIHGKNGAAALLKINPSTLRSRIQKLGLNITRTVGLH